MIRSTCSNACRFIVSRSIGNNGSALRRIRPCPLSYHHHTSLLLTFRPPQRETIRNASSSPPAPHPKMIRLSKRMGELDMFSRREADRLILDGRVLVDGSLVEVGHKIPPDLSADRIEIIDGDGDPQTSHGSVGRRNPKHRNGSSISSIHSTNRNRMTTVVLNKPKGYVSGQAEHGHPPAIRLLTSENRMWGTEDQGDRDSSSSSSSDNGDSDGLSWDARHRRHYYDWMGFAPAGRLDLDSTGLLVFTKHGVLAKKLVGAASSVEKEYIADVEPASRPTRRELSMDPKFVLPLVSSSSSSSAEHQRQRYDLAPILKGGGLLLGDDRPLKACPEARWIVPGKTLQLVLTEGRKHQIRRMCRELLGYHVVGLHRVRIGPIVLAASRDTHHNEFGFDEDGDNGGVLPEGCWRPLRQNEIELLIPNARQ